jgi:electron transport complex protein RnfG
MKNLGTVALKLFLICAVAAIALGGVDALTEPVIVQRKIAELQAALQELAPGAQVGEALPVEDNGVVKVRYPLTEAGQPAGAILELAAMGYGGDMKVLARLETDGTIRAVRLMEDSETPGLGKKAENPAYMGKFVGTGGAERPVPVRKSSLSAAEADAITGATITYLGLSRALAEGARYVREGR